MITNQELNVRVKYLNRILKRDDTNEIFIDKYQPGDSRYIYKLAEISGLGQSDWTNYRLTKSEFYAYLNGIIDGLERIKNVN